MTASELKRLHEERNPDSYFFTRDSMRFFGDTMKNYGVRIHKRHFELYRRHPVKHGLQKSAYFDKESLKRCWPQEGEKL